MNPQVEELLEQFKQAKANCELAISIRNKIGIELAEAIASAPPEEPIPAPKKKPKKKAPPGGRKTNVDRAAKEYMNYEPKASGCLCGCGEEVTGKFVRGHHHRLRAIVDAVEADKLSIDTIPLHAREHVRTSMDCSSALKQDLDPEDDEPSDGRPSE